MNIIEIINDLQLSSGDSKRMNCPTCGGRNTFTVTNAMGKVIWNCYKASCPVSGGTNVSMSVSDVRKALGYMVDELEPSPFKKPDYLVQGYGFPEVHKFCKLYGLDPKELKLLYDVKENRIVFPIMKDGKMVDGSGRCLSHSPIKWKRYGKSDLPYTFGCGTVAVVVEDSVSAAVVGATANRLDASSNGVYVGVAVLGTSLSEGHKRYLSQFSTIIVALDPDAIPKSLKFAKELRTYCKNVRVLKLIDDLKYRNQIDIENLETLTLS
ncbi:MAG: hypothetical protein CMF96_07100 [Candidatus Marinimicrobia bacterium]|nr:hypothetical protein [Candidatus Neomarinimicrobiota bacterium]MAJ44495.1 hypothetical protein [Candidatus Neomarinimicrobiota bacterium]